MPQTPTFWKFYFANADFWKLSPDNLVEQAGWNVGGHDADAAMAFIKDLSERVTNRFQLSTDGFKVYLTAVEEAFGAGY